jgi:hypothetical protein
MVLDGLMNSACFKAYVNRVLVLVLKPGDIVVMDNLSAHKSEDIRSAVKAQALSCVIFRLTPQT